MTILERMAKIDRRIIFVLIALAVIIPMMLKLVFVVRPSPIVQAIFDKVESLPEGSRVLLSYDYGPSTVPENQPMADALARHCLQRGIKLYLMAVWATGDAQCNTTVSQVIQREFPNIVYGTDYVQLGFKAGNQGLINAIFNDLKGMYTTDARGIDINSYEMMAEVNGLKDFDLILSVSSGKPGLKEWIQFAGDRGNIPIAGGCTAVEAPLLYPYYPHQLLGLMGGLQGAAEYEAALVSKYPQYKATTLTAVRSMGPQTVAHFVIIFFVVVGNVTYFVQRRKEKQAR
jgi:hypothetical protein